jgi:hypothetical protein
MRRRVPLLQCIRHHAGYHDRVVDIAIHSSPPGSGAHGIGRASQAAYDHIL